MSVSPFFTSTLSPTKPRSCYTTSLRIPRPPQTNGAWCLTEFPMGTISRTFQPSMKHVTQASVQRYFTCGLIFSFHRHSRRLGQQLKFLYVAVTRARNNLWVMDSSESAEPMRVLRIFRSRKISYPLCRNTGAVGAGSRTGRLLPRCHVWRFRPPLKNGQRLGKRQY